ncbi:hypothetical protein Tco_1009974 [Tanacetum coccineum]
MDDLAKISLTVYVSNFLSHLTIRELWNICGKKGTLMDVFIAKHKNKLGRCLPFVGSLRFDRKAALKPSHAAKASVSDGVKVDTSYLNGSGDNNPPITLKHVNSNDFLLALLNWDNSYSDDGGSIGMHGQEVEGTPDDDHDAKSAENTDEELHGTGGNDVKPKDNDPFNVDSLIQKKCVKNTKPISSDTPKFPPGYNPNINGDQLDSHLDACK